MGQTRRILLSDTLLADYSEDEIEVILAHELAHHVHRDLWRGIARAGGGAGRRVLRRRRRAAARWRIRSGCAGIVRSRRRCRCCCWSAACGRSLLLPLANAHVARAGARRRSLRARRRHGNVDAFVTAMKRLSQQNLAEEHPSPLVRWLFYSHPPIRERIDAARAFGRESDHHAA